MDTAFGIPFFNGPSFMIVVGRLAIDLLVVTLLSSIYLSASQKKDSLFTFIAFNIPVFFLIYLMSLTQISLGIGFGLFAIFTVLRYRTRTVSLKEMSYLFLFISVAVINGLVISTLSFVELALFNTLIVMTAWLLEKFVQQETVDTLSITYDNLELLKPENRDQLLLDLNSRLGYEIRAVEIKSYDLTIGKAKISVELNSDAPRD